MKIVCPKDKDHQEFITVCHEAHDWKVDEDGEFLEDLGCIETTHGPDAGNEITCHHCGTKAEVIA